MLLRIMSFNTQHCLNFITRQIDFDRMAQAIRECRADIIGLNEIRDAGTHPEYQAQVKILAEKLGYPYYYFAQAIDAGNGNPYGNGLISRYPLLSAETIPVPDPEKTGDYFYGMCL